MQANQGSWIRRSGWMVLFILSLLLVVLGAGEMFSGQGGDPEMVVRAAGESFASLQAREPHVAHLLDLTAKVIGALWIGLGTFGAFTAWNAFRAGEKWAWWAFWTVPLVNLLILIGFATTPTQLGSAVPPAFYSAPIMILIVAVVLFASRRNFSPSSM